MAPNILASPQVQIIAEAGVNHNGDIGLALKLVEAAAEAGADFVKFQSFRADKLATATVDKAAYQKDRTGSGSQQDMLAKLQISVSDHEKLIKHCKSCNIRFLSSAFDHDSLDLLTNDLNLDLIKFGSGELTNAPLLYKAARRGVSMILSSGMATLGEMEETLALLALAYTNKDEDAPEAEQWWRAYAEPTAQKLLKDKVAMLHCVTAYPADDDQLDLQVISTLKSALPIEIGYSDHSTGATAALASVALGARIIEKHLTLDNEMEGPDHKASMNPQDFRSFVHGIRACETMLGSSIKRRHPIEQMNARVARKSLVAAKPISAGEAFTSENLTVKRPGYGRSPMLYWTYIGKNADRDYLADELID